MTGGGLGARMVEYLRSIDPRLPPSVWTMEAGGLVNAFGTGITYPFVVIYLHNVRGISLGTAGLVLATNGAMSFAASPVAGTLSDRIGGRRTLAGSLVLMAIGVGSFPLVHEPWQAFLAMAVAGAGNGGFWPSQSTMLVGLAPEARRHAAPDARSARRRSGATAATRAVHGALDDPWEIGFVVGPAIGGFALQREPLALWPLAAFVCLLAGAGALALERGIPPPTPHPSVGASAAAPARCPPPSPGRTMEARTRPGAS